MARPIKMLACRPAFRCWECRHCIEDSAPAYFGPGAKMKCTFCGAWSAEQLAIAGIEVAAEVRAFEQRIQERSTENRTGSFSAPRPSSVDDGMNLLHFEVEGSQSSNA